MSSDSVRWISHPDQYRGDAVIGVDVWASSGSGRPPTTAQRRHSFERWATFFEQATPIRDLSLTRVTDEVLAALRPQTRLTRLSLAHGPYTDLSHLASMPGMIILILGGATQLTDLRPLAQLPTLVELEIENARRLRDYSPLGELRALRRLRVWPSFTGPRTDADSLDFLGHLTRLDELHWSPRVATKDYSPLLGLTGASRIAVEAMKGMTPSMADLEWALPGMQARARELAEQRWPVFSSDGEVQMMSRDLQGRITVESVDPEVAEELLDGYDPFDFGLSGPVAGRTIRTITHSALTRTEDLWLSVERPLMEDDVAVPPPEHRVLGSFAWEGPAEGPLLVWDAPLPTDVSAADFFAGNIDTWTPREEIRLVTAHLPLLPEPEFQRIIEVVRAARGRRLVTAARDQLAAEDDDFVLRFAQSVAVRAVALAPAADRLIALGTIRPDEFIDGIGSLITAGDEAVRATVTDPGSVRRSDLHPARDAVFALPYEVMARRRRADLDIITSFDEEMASRKELDDGFDEVEGGYPPDLTAARAVVSLGGHLRERVVLVDCSGVRDSEINGIVRAALAHFGGSVEAGPELASAEIGALANSTHAMGIRRRSSLPVDEYVARHSALP